MKNINTEEKKMPNKIQEWLNDWIEIETNKANASAKEERKESISKVEYFIRDWIASETNSPVSN